MTEARVASVNVGAVRTIEWFGREVTTAIWKEPVSSPVAVTGVNLAGDDQADRRVHGGPEKAVYAYAVEDYAWWAQHARGRFDPGTFGENLTTQGLDVTSSAIGDRWSVGTAVLEVCQPREPCFKLGIRMADNGFPDRFAAARRPGAYLRILAEGEVATGDAIVVRPTAGPPVTLGQLVAPELDRALLEVIVHHPRIADGWRRRAERLLRS